MKGTPTVLGHIVGNADLLAIRFRDTLKNRRYDLQLWIEYGQRQVMEYSA